MHSSLQNYTLLVILLSLRFITVNAQIQIDDKCTLLNGKPGKCQRIESCPSAIQIIRNQGKPDHCGFEGTRPIVCCKLQKQVGEISKQKCLEIYPAVVPIPVGGPGSELEPNDYSLGGPIIETELTPDSEIRMKREVRVTRRKSIDISLVDPVHEIAGGQKAEPLEFPHMAALGYGEESNIKWFCGGSLISEKYVLTAAHCINSLAAGPVKFIRLGDVNLKLTTDNAKPQNFKIARAILHPQYRAPSVYNDIALIELSSKAIFNDYVQPACLQTEMNITETKWGATGWGLTSFGGSQSDHLQNVELRSYSFDECQSIYASTSSRRLKNGIDFKSQICAGELNKDTCQGDSGGPLQVRQGDKPWRHHIIIGITSFGKACGLGDKPAVYTRVSNYIEWIESVVWPS